MEYRVKYGPVFSILEVDLNEAELVQAQPNSMLAMTPGIRLSAKVGRDGSGWAWWSGMKGMLGGENLFTAEFQANRDGQTLTLAPEAYGEILVLPLAGVGGFYLTRGAYLANVGDCQLNIKYGGLKGVMSKTGIFLLHAQGQGTVFCQSFGAIVERDLSDGEHFVLDNRFVVAFADTIQYQLVKATKSTKDSLMSGEGLVNRYTGPGRLFYQTRAKQTIGMFSRLINMAT